MDLLKLLTEREQKARQRWFWVLVAEYAFSLVAFVGLAWDLTGGQMSLSSGSSIHDRILRWTNFATVVSFPLNWVLYYLTYQLCFKRYRTALLTFILICCGFGFFGTAVVVSQNVFSIGMMHFVSVVLMTAMFVYSWKVRKMNQILRCYQKFSTQCEYGTARLRDARDLGELKAALRSSKKEWPGASAVFKREYRSLVHKF